MNKMYIINPHDSINATFIFSEINKNGKRKIKDAYKHLICEICGKIREVDALQIGLEAQNIRSRRPFILSLEDFNMVSEGGKAIFEKILPDLLQYYHVPTTKYFVVVAASRNIPIDTDPGFRMLNKCKACGRYREVLWGKQPPKLDKPVQFFSYQFESWVGMHECWLVNEDTAKEFESVSSQLTGIAITPKLVNQQATELI